MSKQRIMISLDIDGNEILDKSIREAIEGEVRSLTRSAFEKVFREEVERIVNNRLKVFRESDGNYWSRQRIQDRLDDIIFKELANLHLTPSALKQRANDILDDVAKKAQAEIDYLDEKVDREIEKRVKQRFEDVVLERVLDSISKALGQKNGGDAS